MAKRTMLWNDRDLRILICTANLGNARPDEESLAALIPDDGCWTDVVTEPSNTPDDPYGHFSYPIPTSEEQTALWDDMGFHKVMKRETPLKSTTSEEFNKPQFRRTLEPQRNQNSCFSNRLNLDNHFDIIVLGMQEATFDVDAQDPLIRAVPAIHRKAVGKQIRDGKLDSRGDWLESNDSKLLGSLLHARCPSYEFLVRFQRGEMRLEILIRKGMEVDLLSLSAQNTGIGVNGIMNAANKGGIVAELLVDKSTRIAICTAHLQAHEGKDRYDDRCRMISAILDGTAPEGPLAIDLSHRSHFTFFLGDLNFRTELPGGENYTKEEHIQKVMDIVQRQDWRQLNLADELFKALRLKDCLVGFKTLPCFFPPTFKVERCAGLVYKNQRRPSYTDRILWRTLHKLEQHINPMAYEPVLDFTTSDHKPVRGAFTVKLNDRIQPRRPKEKRRMSIGTKELFLYSTRKLGGNDDTKLHLFISNIMCGLRKRTMAPDPVVVFMSFPYNLIQQKDKIWTKVARWFRTSLDDETEPGQVRKKNRKDGSGFPRTKKLRSTYNPQWMDEIDFAVATHNDEGRPHDLTGSVLFAVVIDKAPTMDDKIIGVLPLNLAYLATSTSQDIRPTLPPKSKRKGGWNSLRDIWSGSVTDPPIHDGGQQQQQTNNNNNPLMNDSSVADNRLLNLKQPLSRYGKHTGWISLTIDSKWLTDSETIIEREVRSTSSSSEYSRRAPATSYIRTSVRNLFGRLAMVEETTEIPPPASQQQHDALSGSTRSQGTTTRNRYLQPP